MSDDILVKVEDGIYWITLNKEKKFNSITGDMYRALCAAFDSAQEDDDVVLTVMTGNGLYYCAGSDFTPAELAAEAEYNSDKGLDNYGPYKLWADRLIRHKKPLIALVNGPAVGIGVTSLALCDAVFASDKATFWCPFTQLGLNPEAASSITFVHTLGYNKAARLALFAEKMTAEEAYVAGLVTKVIPHSKFQEETREIVQRYSKLAKYSMWDSKKLLRPAHVVEELLTANRREYEVLMNLMSSEETLNRIMSKFTKSKM